MSEPQSEFIKPFVGTLVLITSTVAAGALTALAVAFVEMRDTTVKLPFQLEAIKVDVLTKFTDVEKRLLKLEEKPH